VVDHGGDEWALALGQRQTAETVLAGAA